MPTQACILSHPHGCPADDAACSAAANLRNLLENIVRISGEKIAAHYIKPMRIDMKEHNNEIPDEIMAEIRNSQFVVADFTGQRKGVYYEAGFAMGLGRPVIWCCRGDHIKDLHFDTNHRNHIPWSSPEDLREKLHRRIKATTIQQR